MDILKKVTDEQEERMNMHNIDSDLDYQFYSILRSLKTVRPTSGNNYAYGPFIYTNTSPLRPSDYQKHVAEKLSIKLRDNLRSKYSSYG